MWIRIEACRRLAYATRLRCRLYGERLWFYPLVFALGALMLFVLTAVVDRHITLASTAFGGVGIGQALIFGGTGDAARTILSAISSGWATIMGVVYSITIVVLQLAGTKFTSQLIPRFERDHIMQLTLGSFTGLVAYALLVLKTVRYAATPGETFVPVIGVNLALLWAIVDLFMVIVFIARLAHLIEPASLVRNISREGINALASLSASITFRWLEPVSSDEKQYHDGPDERTRIVHATRDGYVEGIDWEPLLQAVRRLLAHVPSDERLQLDLEQTVDARVDTGEPLGRVVMMRADEKVQHALASWLQQTVLIAAQRTTRRDPLYAIEELTSIGIKAIINGDVDVADECLRGLFRFYAAAMEHAVPVRLRVRNGDRSALITLPAPNVRLQTLQGIERLMKQVPSRAYAQLVATYFGESRRLFERLVRQHDAAVQEDGKVVDGQRERSTESLELLLGDTVKLYALLLREYGDKSQLAGVLSQWVAAARYAVEREDKLAEQLLDLLRRCADAAAEEPEQVRAIIEGFDAIVETAQRHTTLLPLVARYRPAADGRTIIILGAGGANVP